MHILDADCGAEAVLEASLLAERYERMICIGPAPQLGGWRGWMSGQIPRASTSRLARGGELARRLGDCVACCWSIGAARRVAELTFARPPAVVVRLTRPVTEAQLRELAPRCRAGTVAVVAATASAAQALRRAKPGDNVHVIEPPARPASLSGEARTDLRERLGLAAGEIAIAAAGPASRVSGHKLAAWAVGILAVAEYPVRLLIEQTHQASRRAADFIRQAGFAQHLVHAGADLPLTELLAAADLGVFVGLEAPPPATTAAAMAAGLPIVASDIPAAGDFFVDGVTAVLVRPDSPRDISRGLAEAIEQPELAQRLGQAGRSLAAERFNPDSIAASWQSLCRQLLAGAARTQLNPAGG